MQRVLRTTTRFASRQGAILVLLLCVVVGCNSMPQFDPTGERLLVTEPPGAQRLPIATALAEQRNPNAAYCDVATRAMPGSTRRIVVEPRRSIAMVGTEVVLTAGVLDVDGYLRTNQRVEWCLGGVGQFVTVDRGSWLDPLVGDFTNARKVDSRYAVNSTSRRLLRITCGTPSPCDDVQILRGQAWLTVTSAQAGDTHVTACAPAIDNWIARQQTAVIHWIDACVTWPTAAVAPAGASRPITTTVQRQTDGSPCPCWIVRYEIVGGGPEAGFAPDGAQIVEQRTDETGQATVMLTELEPAAGATQIAIQVIRPADLASQSACAAGERLVVGQGSTNVTWSSSQLMVTPSGPVRARVGETLSYCMVVANAGDLPSEHTQLTVELPLGLSYVGSQPRGMLDGRTFRYVLGTLGAGQQQSIRLDLAADREGAYDVRGLATADGLTSDSGSITTDVGAAASPAPGTTPTMPDIDTWVEPTRPVEVTALGPETQRLPVVGSTCNVGAYVENNGATPLVDHKVRFSFGSGFEHRTGNSVVVVPLPTLAPGTATDRETTPLIELDAIRPGASSLDVEVLDRDGFPIASDRITIEILPATASPPSVYPSPEEEPSAVSPGPAPAPAAEEPPLRLRVTTSPVTGSLEVGQTVLITAEATNISASAVSDVTIVMKAIPTTALTAKRATPGFRQQIDDALAYSLDPIAPGRFDTFKVQYEAATATPGATVTISLLAGGREVDRETVSLTVRGTAAETSAPGAAPPASTSAGRPGTASSGAAAPPLSASPPFASGNPLQIAFTGGARDLEIKDTEVYPFALTNAGYESLQDVRVEVVVSPDLVVSRWGTTGATAVKIEENPDATIVRFDPIATLAPGAQEHFNVEVVGEGPVGSVASITASATSRSFPDPTASLQQIELPIRAPSAN